MNPRLEHFPGKFLLGFDMAMSLAANRTQELWRTFLQQKKRITNTIGTDLYSVQIYPKNYFGEFSLQREFTRWATVEVSAISSVPEGMKSLQVPAGLYAVFLHKGAALMAEKTMRFIFQEWLPASDFMLDDRPHFEVLGKKYRNDDPESEEDIWIPVTHKPLDDTTEAERSGTRLSPSVVSLRKSLFGHSVSRQIKCDHSIV